MKPLTQSPSTRSPSTKSQRKDAITAATARRSDAYEQTSFGRRPRRVPGRGAWAVAAVVAGFVALPFAFAAQWWRTRRQRRAA
jgi:hypothetical protein